MAYFVRSVLAGGDLSDPRSYRYAVYHCSVCGEEFDITMKGDFQFRERVCKHCGSMGVSDRIFTLKAERESVIKQITSLNVQLLKLETELSELEPQQDRILSGGESVLLS